MDWRITICVVPELHIEFDQALYLPGGAGKTKWVEATLTLGEDLEFAPRTPAEVKEQGERLYTVRVDRSEDALHGLVCHIDNPDIQIPVSASIPKAKWRLQGLDEIRPDAWYDTVEEVWFGDWETAEELHLIVAVPSGIEGSFKLGLTANPSREETRRLAAGKTRFNLLAFGETFRAGPSLQTFTMTLSDLSLEINKEPLLNVRTRWEVTELQCVQEPQGHAKNLLTVTWAEWGKTGEKQRCIRLWSTKDTHLPPVLEQRVPEGEQHAKLEADVGTVPPGKYLLQICLRDPWSAPRPLFPAPGSANTLEIEIFAIEDIRQGELVSLCYIVDDRHLKRKLEPDFYKIRIIGKIINRRLPTRFRTRQVLVTRANEGWYVGDLEVPPDSDLESEVARSNPVKFEYNASRDQIMAVEDREGDGAMYCCDCRNLYWSRSADNEERAKGHRIIGPIELFGVSWM